MVKSNRFKVKKKLESKMNEFLFQKEQLKEAIVNKNWKKVKNLDYILFELKTDIINLLFN